MFTLKVDRGRKLIEATFSGCFDAADLRKLDAAARVAFASEGPMDALFDFTLVETVALPDRLIADRGRVPQVCPGYKRVIVTSNPELFQLFRVYGAYQAVVGSEPPVIVSNKGMALSYLDHAV